MAIHIHVGRTRDVVVLKSPAKPPKHAQDERSAEGLYEALPLATLSPCGCHAHIGEPIELKEKDQS